MLFSHKVNQKIGKRKRMVKAQMKNWRLKTWSTYQKCKNKSFLFKKMKKICLQKKLKGGLLKVWRIRNRCQTNAWVNSIWLKAFWMIYNQMREFKFSNRWVKWMNDSVQNSLNIYNINSKCSSIKWWDKCRSKKGNKWQVWDNQKLQKMMMT